MAKGKRLQKLCHPERSEARAQSKDLLPPEASFHKVGMALRAVPDCPAGQTVLTHRVSRRQMGRLGEPSLPCTTTGAARLFGCRRPERPSAALVPRSAQDDRGLTLVRITSLPQRCTAYSGETRIAWTAARTTSRAVVAAAGGLPVV